MVDYRKQKQDKHSILSVCGVCHKFIRGKYHNIKTTVPLVIYSQMYLVKLVTILE